MQQFFLGETDFSFCWADQGVGGTRGAGLPAPTAIVERTPLGPWGT